MYACNKITQMRKIGGLPNCAIENAVIAGSITYAKLHNFETETVPRLSAWISFYHWAIEHE